MGEFPLILWENGGGETFFGTNFLGVNEDTKGYFFVYFLLLWHQSPKFSSLSPSLAICSIGTGMCIESCIVFSSVQSVVHSSTRRQSTGK